ncbi:transketolase-like TK C-terminal-containing protein [Candidatus Nesciobacter abundans]|nr:hypothetical protein [Candidatus Nesciobacter abundans]
MKKEVLRERKISTNLYRKMASDKLRLLSLEMVEEAQSGHQGIALGMADVFTVLWSKFINYKNKYQLRDRFILSAGHGSALLYSTLYCLGIIKNLNGFRSIDSDLNGHPELSDVIEMTTGPLGQGLGWSVGIAKAAQEHTKLIKKECLRLSKEKEHSVEKQNNEKPDEDQNEEQIDESLNNKINSLLDNSNRVFVVVSDGDLMEGVSHEVSELAANWKLSNLTVLWDDNSITIDGQTDLSKQSATLDVFKAYGWNVFSCDGHDFEDIEHKIEQAVNSEGPSIIGCKTKIGKGSEYEGLCSVHGKIIDRNGLDKLKEDLGFNYSEKDKFELDDEICDFWNLVKNRMDHNFEQLNRVLDGLDKNILKTGSGLDSVLELDKETSPCPSQSQKLINKTPEFMDSLMKDNSTRKISGMVLDGLFDKEKFWIGSADLGESTCTMGMKNYIPFGVREHGMVCITGGICLYGFKAACATFLVFTDYARPAIRLAALMRTPLIIIATHDSISVGEDGPTHQPIEQIESFRAMPNVDVYRPCNGLEVLYSWENALGSKNPSIICLSRQKLKFINQENIEITCNQNYNKISGGYLIKDFSGLDKGSLSSEKDSVHKSDLYRNVHEVNSNENLVVILSSGSEVSLSVDVAEMLLEQGIKSKVFSIVCMEKISDEFEKEITAPYIVSIEASSSKSWYEYLRHASVDSLLIGCLEFGYSGKEHDVRAKMGLEKNIILERIMSMIENNKK